MTNNLEKVINENEHAPPATGSNDLFPVFLKLEHLSVLIVGGGHVGMEKLKAVLQNSPATAVRIVASQISDEIRSFSKDFNVTLVQRPYQSSDIDGADIVIAALNDREVSLQVSIDAKQKEKLVNVADKPDLCDFYLSSVVQKGSIKIAISTNGKSPTIAKRLKEVIGTMIPDEMENVLDNMQSIRKEINGSFEDKVKELNNITKILVSKQSKLGGGSKREPKKWYHVVLLCLVAFMLMILGHAFFSYMPFHTITGELAVIIRQVDSRAFLLMLFTGFIAQMADGSLGMGYGTISTTFLLAYGVPPAIVSSRVHSARVFSSGVSGYSHHRFGNINKKLFKALVIPGVIGAALGAVMAYFGQRYAPYVRVPLSFYTIYLGYFIIKKAFNKKKREDRVKQVGWLASAGGFMDAFAGGGWGALVTSTLIAKRKSPRYVIGSVCLAEFFVVLTSSILFFILLKSIPLVEVAGLIAGGLIAAPIAARLVGKLPLKTMFVAIGSLVIITSIATLWKAIAQLL